MKIRTEWQGVCWSAVDNDTYDGAEDTKWPCNCIGIGRTEEEAIADLKDQLMDAGSFLDSLPDPDGPEAYNWED
jgi:hypothetical protein